MSVVAEARDQPGDDLAKALANFAARLLRSVRDSRSCTVGGQFEGTDQRASGTRGGRGRLWGSALACSTASASIRRRRKGRVALKVI